MTTDTPTPEQVEAIRERRGGPWHGLDEYGVIARQDADITTLLAAYDALTAEVERLRDAQGHARGRVLEASLLAEARRARAEAAERKVAAVQALVEDRNRRVVLSQRTSYGEHTDYSDPLVRVEKRHQEDE